MLISVGMLIISMGIRISMGVLVFGSVGVGVQGQSHPEDALSEEGQDTVAHGGHTDRAHIADHHDFQQAGVLVV